MSTEDVLRAENAALLQHVQAQAAEHAAQQHAMESRLVLVTQANDALRRERDAAAETTRREWAARQLGSPREGSTSFAPRVMARPSPRA